MTIPFDDLFETLGKAFAVQSACNTARGTTLPAAVDGLLTQFNSLDPDATLEATAIGIPSALTGGQSGLSALLSGMSTFCSQYLIATVNADNPQANRTLPTALAELIKQMKANSETVDASTPGVSVAYGSSNIGTGKLIFSTKRGDGLIQENIIPETILARVSGSGQTASIAFTGQQAAPSLLDHNWPDGSGLSTTINSISAASSLLANGDMEDEDDVANAPDDWNVIVGTIGTTVLMTDVKVQTVVISGTPTGGFYRLTWTNPQSQSRTTGILAYNADGTAVQTALRTIPGLELVTVVTTGTTPNFTHTVTMTGRGGQVAEFTSVSGLTGGTPVITHNTTVAGSSSLFTGGKSLQFTSNGSQLTTIQQRVTLNPLTCYAVSFWAARSAAMSTGRLCIDLVDGNSGTVLEDAQGFPNSISFLGNDASGGWKHSTQLVSAVDEQQTITITGTPTGGSFTLTFDGQTTGSIAHNASAADVVTALVALSNIASGDVTGSGGALPGTPVVITFTSHYAGRSVATMTAVSSLTGGSAPAIAITVTRPGSPAEPVFRTPAVLPAAVYFRIRIAVAIENAKGILFDDVALSAMQALYLGGPMFAAFSPGAGPNLSAAEAWATGDTFTITVSNDRAGLFQEFFQRNFSMTSLSLLLPSDAFGNETLADSLIA